MISLTKPIFNIPRKATILGIRKNDVFGMSDTALKNKIDYTHATASTNMTNRFAPIMKENRKLLIDVRKDIKTLKTMDNLAQNINPLTDSIMARSDIYKTISALRNAERSAIAEMAKLTLNSIKLEIDINKNLNGDGDDSPRNATGDLFRSFISGGETASGINGTGVTVAPEPITQTTPTMTPPPIESEPTKDDDAILDSILDDGVTATKTVPLDDAPISIESKEASMFDYNQSIAGMMKAEDNTSELVLAFCPSNNVYCQAYKTPDGLLLDDPTLVPIATLGNVAIDTNKGTASDGIGNKYSLVIVDSLPTNILEEFEAFKKK